MSAWRRSQPIPDGAYTVQFTWNSTALQALLSALKDGYPSGYSSMVDHVGRAINGSPLVVIDPEDAEAVARLADIVDEWWGRVPYSDMRKDGDLTTASALQAALREFANPTPPKPDEPQGLGAVVRDGIGNLWIRWSLRPDAAAWRTTEPNAASMSYAGIDAVEVLSEGWSA